jgi:hypothetical protein
LRKNYVGELANLTTKIITLLEFFSFVSKVSRLQYAQNLQRIFFKGLLLAKSPMNFQKI